MEIRGDSHELVLSFHHVGLRIDLRSSGLNEDALDALPRVSPVIHISPPILNSVSALGSEMVAGERFLSLLINWLSEVR